MAKNFRKYRPTEEQPQQSSTFDLMPPIQQPKRSVFRGTRGFRNYNQQSEEHRNHITQLQQLQHLAVKPPSQLKNFPSVISKSASLRQSHTPKSVNRADSAAIPRLPQTSKEEKQGYSGGYVLQNFRSDLSDYEKSEILQYGKVYCWGQNAQKNYNSRAENYGYDDSRSDYTGVLKDHVAYRYELQQLLGQGSFGKVFKALDHATGQSVALKVVRNKKRFHRQGLVEVRLLETLKKNDPDGICCCVAMHTSFFFRSHLVMIFEICGMNLYELLVKNELRGLNPRIIQKIALQCIKALCYSYNLQMIHADIKPENILLCDNKSSDIKVIDWGSGAFVGQTIYTYIQSRFYRAPEVILGLKYSTEIDIWSMACVFAELFTGVPLFSGEEEKDQLGKILEVLGNLPEHMVMNSPRREEFFINKQLRTRHRVNHKSLTSALPNCPGDLLDLIRRMLILDPEKRAKPHELIQHQYFKTLIDEQNIQILQELGVGVAIPSVQTQQDEEREVIKPAPEIQAVESLGFKLVNRPVDGTKMALPDIGKGKY